MKLTPDIEKIIDPVSRMLFLSTELRSESSDRMLIMDCDHASDNFIEYTRQLPLCKLTSLRIFSAARIKTFLEEGLFNPDNNVFMRKLGWNVQGLEQAKNILESYLQSGEIENVIKDGFDSESEPEFIHAINAAITFNNDVWDIIYSRKIIGLSDPGIWQLLLDTLDLSRFEKAIKLAETQLNFNDLCSGPSLNYGDGDDKYDFQEMDVVLNAIAFSPYKGVGWGIVRPALQSRLVQHRARATYILYSWGVKIWPLGSEEALQAAIFKEYDPKLKEMMTLVARKAPVPYFNDENFDFFPVHF